MGTEVVPGTVIGRKYRVDRAPIEERVDAMRMRKRSRPLATWLAVGLSVAGLPDSRPCRAQSSGDAERASTMFEDGKRLMAAQRYHEACQRFEASDVALPSGRAVLNLADCLEKDGRFASAWTRFQACAARAHGAGLPDIEKYASDRAAALALKVTRVVLTPAPVDDGSLTISVDGRPVERSLWAGFPVDPGPHDVTATAKGKKSWSGGVVAEVGRDRVTVPIPVLEDGGFGVSSVVPNASPAGQEPSGEHAAPTQRVVAVALGAVGILVLGLGSFLGLSAKASYDNSSCGAAIGEPANVCNSVTGKTEQGSAETKADLSTGAFIVAGAALAGGAVLWFTAPSHAKLTAGATPAGVFLRGSF
jgi:hypothetical protein